MGPTRALLAALLTVPALAAGLGATVSTSWSLAPRVPAAAAWVAAGGLAWLLAITAAARLASGRRRVLALAYRPAFYLTLAAVLALAVAHAALGIAMFRLLLGLSATTDQVGFWLSMPTCAPAAGAVFAVMALVDSAFVTLGAGEPPRLVGLSLSRQRSPELWRLVDEVAASAGAPVPDHIVATPAPLFMAAAPVIEASGSPIEGLTLVCSFPLADALSVDDLRAVIAHELAHFRERDWELWMQCQGIAARGADALQNLVPTEDLLPPAQLALWPARQLLMHFAKVFLLAERAVSRQDELQRDRAAATVTTPLAIATALLRLELHARPWRAVEFSTGLELLQGRRIDARALYAQLSSKMVDAETLTRALADDASHPFDLHPSTPARVRALGVGDDAIHAQRPWERALEPASRLFGDLDDVGPDLIEDHARALIPNLNGLHEFGLDDGRPSPLWEWDDTP